MADADVRWLQRLENYERALATLERALTLAARTIHQHSNCSKRICRRVRML